MVLLFGRFFCKVKHNAIEEGKYTINIVLRNRNIDEIVPKGKEQKINEQFEKGKKNII